MKRVVSPDGKQYWDGKAWQQLPQVDESTHQSRGRRGDRFVLGALAAFALMGLLVAVLYSRGTLVLGVYQVGAAQAPFVDNVGIHNLYGLTPDSNRRFPERQAVCVAGGSKSAGVGP